MITAAAFAILLPFLSAAAGLLGSRFPQGRRGGAADTAANRRAAWIAVVPTAISTVLAIWAAYAIWAGAPSGGGTPLAPAGPGVQGAADGVTAQLTVIPTGSVPISVGLLVDGLSASVAVLVTVVALAVQVYSVGYLGDDRRYPSYSSFISLFTSAMLLVVYAADLLLLYVGWEIMGLCSYLLVGHWWEDRANSRAAVKAFLVTRIGDVGFLFGIFVLGTEAGSFAIEDVVAGVPEMSSGAIIAATMLLLAGVAGKSAQVPLHVWLPDAMAGPTPISALIHAATMVAAGIFVVARLYPVFLGAGPTLDVLAVLAALGMLGAALAALAQDDLKRVLAYSTISQLAYMAGALAAGSRSSAIFHLITHGAFKALLFLCAGAVIHVVGSNLMSAMGGLRRQLPVTFVAMTIGFAALTGLPPASGFFSKDEVLVAIERSVSAGPLTGAVALLLYGCALVTVAVTGAYATRAWLRTFFGARHDTASGTARANASGTTSETMPGTAHATASEATSGPHAAASEAVSGKTPATAHSGAREAPATMRWPIVVLAVPALLLGFAGAAEIHWDTAALSVGVALLGAGAVYAMWRSDPAADPARVLGPFRAPCERAFYADSVYDMLFVQPALGLARLVACTDRRVVDGAVRGSGRMTLGLAGLVRLAQNGNAQLYVTGLLAGVLLIAIGAVVLG
ncbi:NADH-quinone oxidoreductase subunit L [Streptosporangium becharense]|uniref:NADH-quinone oxidoreductase subunit L n=1 Tax=Streptosporangium becharense TaxID=1816182 RepID=A0A7W9IFR8_9ACTN|nr:NADH-quinone oxidoreductase subunit L [Streptosporangium becharense]MBB2909134.1 NADH-quinone oxidoreductase subunit L [Streptosporangium becharense]MBB5819847.1 NADH-quinone oxidoreductase subunit L [Streptosporangium becharense]